MDRHEHLAEKLEPTGREGLAAAAPARTQGSGIPASRRKHGATPDGLANPGKAHAATAATPPNASRVPPAAPRPGSLEAYLVRVAEIVPTWSRRRRIRALQELLGDAKQIIVFAIDEIERERSGVRLSAKVRT